MRTITVLIAFRTLMKLGLYWKGLPHKTFVSAREAGPLGHEGIKDRVTVMFSADASGKHKIPLLAISKSVHPRCFKNRDIVKPSIFSKAQKKCLDE